MTLSRFTGPAGFLSLLSRALVLAKAEVSSLSVVQVRPDGSLAGFDEIKPDQDVGELEFELAKGCEVLQPAEKSGWKA